jgi:hypothetical protein
MEDVRMDNEIEVNGKKYVLKSSIKNPIVKAKSLNGKEYCIIRTYSAGVFAGFINRKFTGKEAIIFNSRRLWSWDGANNLSQLANDGVKKPSTCKFAQIVNEMDLKEIIEVIPCSDIAKKSIESVSVWQQ